MKILLIIPAYNEEANIARTADELIDHYPQYDYIILNDCSTDTTLDIIRRRQYNYITLPINLGIGGNIQAGYLYAKEQGYDIAIQFDGDGQHDPQYIDRLLDPLINGKSDMVVGSRFLEREGFQSSALRRLGIRIIRTVIKLTCGIEIHDPTSGFRACTKELIHLFAEKYAYDYPEPEAIVTAALYGYRIQEVPVKMKDREGGESSIYGLRSLYYMVKVTLSILLCRLSTK